MDYHTDTRPGREGETCACPYDSAVISVSVGAPMNFWYRKIINGDVSNLGEQRCTPLMDRSSWLWLSGDDHVHTMDRTHGVSLILHTHLAAHLAAHPDRPP